MIFLIMPGKRRNSCISCGKELMVRFVGNSQLFLTDTPSSLFGRNKDIGNRVQQIMSAEISGKLDRLIRIDELMANQIFEMAESRKISLHSRVDCGQQFPIIPVACFRRHTYWTTVEQPQFLD